jgi:hypothetical protein
MRSAYLLASQSLPERSSKFSRKDFTLAQLFACLAVKEMLKRSYRQAEALLADCPEWLKEIGMQRAPDHNTLCRAAKYLLRKFRAEKLLDVLGGWTAEAKMLKLSQLPLAVDSTTYESHHVSRHYEQRCRQTRKRKKPRDDEKSRKSSRSRTVRQLPKLGIAVATSCHLVLSMWTGTGLGADHPHFEPLVLDAWRRSPNRRFKVVADAGYDSEGIHQIARHDMGLVSLIPPELGRPRKDGGPPSGRWRRRMKRVMKTKASRKRSGYTQRWQVETVNSMMKRNLGSELRGKSAHSRKRDMRLKTLVHDLMVV